jgi:four helix bundle protein
MKIQVFEDLKIWQESRKLCKLVFQLSSKGRFKNDYKFQNQIRAAAGSLMDNIAEGFERGGKNEFIQFLYISKGSCSETRSQAHRALDFGYINNTEYESLMRQTDDISKQIYGLISYLKTTSYKGKKYL